MDGTLHFAVATHTGHRVNPVVFADSSTGWRPRLDCRGKGVSHLRLPGMCLATQGGDGPIGRCRLRLRVVEKARR